MKCKDFCPLVNLQGHVESKGTGNVLAGETSTFGIPLEINYRRVVSSPDSRGFNLTPVVPPEEAIPDDAEAVCGLPAELQKRANRGGAGETSVNCPYQSESFIVFSAKKPQSSQAPG